MTKHDPSWASAHFDNYGDKEWERLVGSPSGEISLHIHTHYLKEYLKRGARVLEVGAGAGRFTQVLAQLGCRVLVADISQRQLDLNRKHAEECGFAKAVEDWRRLDACDLSSLKARSFDAVVCYGGPLSYVFDGAGQAIREARRVLKNNGVGRLHGRDTAGPAEMERTPAPGTRGHAAGGLPRPRHPPARRGAEERAMSRPTTILTGRRPRPRASVSLRAGGRGGFEEVRCHLPRRPPAVLAYRLST